MDDDNGSPCIGVCQFDEAGYCLGCGRSSDEVFGKSDSSEIASEVEIVVTTVHPDTPHGGE